MRYYARKRRCSFNLLTRVGGGYPQGYSKQSVVISSTKRPNSISTNRPRRQSCSTFGCSQSVARIYVNTVFEIYGNTVFQILHCDWLPTKMKQDRRRCPLVDIYGDFETSLKLLKFLLMKKTNEKNQVSVGIVLI